MSACWARDPSSVTHPEVSSIKYGLFKKKKKKLVIPEIATTLFVSICTSTHHLLDLLLANLLPRLIKLNTVTISPDSSPACVHCLCLFWYLLTCLSYAICLLASICILIFDQVNLPLPLNVLLIWILVVISVPIDEFGEITGSQAAAITVVTAPRQAAMGSVRSRHLNASAKKLTFSLL